MKASPLGAEINGNQKGRDLCMGCSCLVHAGSHPVPGETLPRVSSAFSQEIRSQGREGSVRVAA